MTAKIHLPATDNREGDTQFVWEGKPGKPAFVGTEPDESLACSNCGTVIGKHISTRTIRERFHAPKRLVFVCACGTNLLLPAQTG